MVSPTPNHPSSLTKHTSLETGDVRDAATLLHQFNVLSLGEGNLNAGANTLTAMALTLANLAPPGSCLIDSEDGASVSIGMNLLISGGLSCAIIEDRALAVLQKLQGNVYAHIRQRLERKKQSEGRISESKLFANKGEKDRPPTLLDRLEKNNFITDACFESEWRSLLRSPLDPEIGEITDAPVFFAGIGSEGGLDSAIGFANKGRLLVHATLTRKADAALLERVIREVVSGCPKRTLLAAGIKGEVIATDPHGTLDELLADGKDCGWLGRMLWLGDHADGPKFDMHEAANAVPGLRRIGDWFSLAIESVAATRLNIHKPSPMELKLSMSGGQARWNSFLLGLDSRFPGIAGTLRPLWASLVFGLDKIASAAPVDQRIRFSPKHVEALVRVLALRMVHHREVILEEALRQFIESLAASFRLKLMEGPHTVRDLMRRSNNLDSDVCRKALELLVDRGDAVVRGREWRLAATLVSVVEQRDQFIVGEWLGRSRWLELETGVVFVDDPVVDEFAAGLAAGADADHVGGGRPQRDACDFHLGRQEVGQVFTAHERRMQLFKKAAQPGIGFVCEEVRVELLDTAGIPVVGDHLAAIGSLDIAEDGRQRVIVLPVGGRPK